MNEKLEKIKEFMDGHSMEIVMSVLFGFGCAAGYVIGQWSMIPLRNELIGIGAQSAVEYVKVNGLEATEKVIKEAYKIK